jgi:hypothetical protein
MVALSVLLLRLSGEEANELADAGASSAFLSVLSPSSSSTTDVPVDSAAHTTDASRAEGCRGCSGISFRVVPMFELLRWRGSKVGEEG